MKKFLLIPVLFSLVLGLSAQETRVSVKVEKDGKVVKDTSYIYDSEEDADHAVRILDMISESDGDDSHKMMFITKDGEQTHVSGDKMVWKSHDDHDHDCEHVKVMKVKVDEGEDGEIRKKVIIVSSEDGETFDILLDEDCDAHADGEEIVVKKEVKVIVKTDDEGDWSVVETEVEEDRDHDEDTEVIVIKKKKKQKNPEKQ